MGLLSKFASAALLVPKRRRSSSHEFNITHPPPAMMPPSRTSNNPSNKSPRLLRAEEDAQWERMRRATGNRSPGVAAGHRVAFAGLPKHTAPVHDKEATAKALLALLSNEKVLKKIGLIASNPLRPADACALAGCNRRLDAAMRAPLRALRARHKQAAALAAVLGWSSCAALRETQLMVWNRPVGAVDARTLGSLLGGGWLPRLKELILLGGLQDEERAGLGDEGVGALCEKLLSGTAPRLMRLGLGSNNIGPQGASAIADALRRGALPGLQILLLENNAVGEDGAAALSKALGRGAAPALRRLDLSNNPGMLTDTGLRALEKLRQRRPDLDVARR